MVQKVSKPRAVKRRYEDGKIVYAKWPGSGFYYKAEIKDFDGEENTYSVRFTEGDDFIYDMAPKDLFAENMVGRTTGDKKRGRGRSTSRSRSRSRSRSTSRSRTKKTAVVKDEDSPESKPRRARSSSRGRRGRSPVKKTDVTEENAPIDVKRVQSEKQASMSNLNEENLSTETINHVAEITMDSEYNKHLELERNKTHLNTIEKTEETISNQEWLSNSNGNKTDKSRQSYSFIRSFFSIVLYGMHNSALIFSGFLTLVIPIIFLVGLYLLCSDDSGSPLFYPNMPTIFNMLEKSPYRYVIGWFSLQSILAALPLGKVRHEESRSLRFNGIASLIISLACVGRLVYNDEFPYSIIKIYYVSTIIAAYLFLLFISLVVYLASRWSAAEEKSGGFIQDFMFGRICNPTLFGGMFDIRTSFFKVGLISWAVLDVLYLENVWRQSLNSNIPLILLVAFQLWYILDKMAFEEMTYDTSKLSKEKMGFTGLSGMIFILPFFNSLQARYLCQQAEVGPMSHCQLRHSLPVLLQVIGYIIYRSSILQKHSFEKETPFGKIVLKKGWWGKVRYPNYLGELLMNLSWALLCGFEHFLPWIWVISLTLSLMCMAVQEDTYSLQKYESTWEGYRKEVKWRIIPYVF